MTSLLPMVGRSGDERHRASTPLELFFDLTFVVGVAFAAEGLAHEIAAGHGAHGLLSYAMVFFAIWWGWLNFTWFASAYDTDDWLYRVVTLIQMSGALVVAAGVPRALTDQDFKVVVVGYLIMRLAMVFQWLRAAGSDPDGRATALRYAAGITVVQVLWVLRLLLPGSLAIASFAVLVLAELAVPAIAERHRMTSFHLGHICERYGLFTLIVLGEGVLASAKSVVAAVDEGTHVTELVVLAAFGLLVIAGMWWIYFQIESADVLGGFGATLTWGYGHYAIFAAAGAVSAGLEVQIEHVTGHAGVSDTTAGLALALPVAVFLLVVWALIIRPKVSGGTSAAFPVVAVLVAAAGALPTPPLMTTVAIAILVAVLVVVLVRRTDASHGKSDSPAAPEPASGTGRTSLKN